MGRAGRRRLKYFSVKELKAVSWETNYYYIELSCGAFLHVDAVVLGDKFVYLSENEVLHGCKPGCKECILHDGPQPG